MPCRSDAQLGNPLQRLGPAVADVGAKALALGPQADVGLGLGSRRKPHRAQRTGLVQRLATDRILHPGGRLDPGPGVVDQEVPAAAGLAHQLFDPVVDVVDISRMFEREVREIDLHHLRVMVEGDSAANLGAGKARLVLRAHAPAGRHRPDRRHRRGEIGEQPRVADPLSLVSGDLGDGFRRLVEPHSAHRMRFLQIASAAGEGEPCRLVHPVALGPDQEEPQRLARLGDALFDPVVERVGLGRGLDPKTGEVDHDQLLRLADANPLVQRRGVEGRSDPVTQLLGAHGL